jgi:hypothetical protein
MTHKQQPALHHHLGRNRSGRQKPLLCSRQLKRPSRFTCKQVAQHSLGWQLRVPVRLQAGSSQLWDIYSRVLCEVSQRTVVQLVSSNVAVQLEMRCQGYSSTT